MPDPLPIVLIPGLTCSARLYADQIPTLWRFGPVTVADHTRDDNMAAIARRILAAAPPRFALAGLSMGGYIAFEVMRQAPQRVAKLALLDTGARAETPEQTERRKVVIALAKTIKRQPTFMVVAGLCCGQFYLAAGIRQDPACGRFWHLGDCDRVTGKPEVEPIVTFLFADNPSDPRSSCHCFK